MKFLFPFLLFPLLFSCSSTDDETIALFDETIELSNEYFYSHNMMYYAFMAGRYEANKSMIKPFKDISDSIRNMHDEIINRFETIKEEHNIPLEFKDQSYWYKKLKLGTSDIFEKAKEFKSFVLINTTDSLLISEINRLLDLNIYKKNNIKYWKLNLLMNKISIAENLILSSLNENTTSINLRWVKMKPVVIQNRNTFKKGEQLNADIWLSVMDTTYEHLIILENKTFSTKNGVFLFKEKAKKIGQRKIKGKLLMQRSGSLEIDSFPFNIEYRTIK